MSPWDGAPLHQSILYDPAADGAAYGVYGPSESSFSGLGGTESWTCMWFQYSGWEASSPTVDPTFYAFTGDAGRTEVPASEQASEYPTTPATLVGLPEETVTGPNVLVYALGLGQAPHIVDAQLRSASGESVEVRTVDGTTIYEGGQALYEGHPLMFPWSGDVIPVKSLQPGTTYDATVEWQGDTGTAIQAFSFTTAIGENDVGIDVQQTAGKWRIHVTSPSPNPQLELSGPQRLRPQLDAHDSVTLHLQPGKWRACATSGGTGTGYRAGSSCRAFTVYAPTIRQLTAHIHGAGVALDAHGVLLGRAATVAFLYRAAPCPANRPLTFIYCGSAILAAKSTTRLAGHQLISAPARWSAERKPTVCISVPRFSKHGIPYPRVVLRVGRWGRQYSNLAPYCI